jgi:hypothetical protein
MKLLSTEYNSLRQEIIQTTLLVRQLQVTLISSSALLLGLIGASDKGFARPIAAFIPFMIFVLCNTGIGQIRDARHLITRISVFIELKMEKNNKLENMPGWESLSSKMYDREISGNPISWIVWHEPLPWLAIVQLTCAVIAANKITMSLFISVLYYAIHIILFFYLIYRIRDLKWPKRGNVFTEITEITNTNSNSDYGKC